MGGRRRVRYPDQQMSSGYGVIWDQATSAASDLLGFAQSSAVQPGNLFLAPCGGDFSQPDASLLDAVNQIQPGHEQRARRDGTFQDFLGAMNAYEAANPGTLQTIVDFDSSYYWTGYFAGRVVLKIRQQRSVNLLMAAETLSTLLRWQANLSGSVLDALERVIDAAWQNLLPSTHHDFVTGTAPDQTYWMEQEPLSALALTESQAAIEEAMARLGQVVKAAPQTGEIPYVVFNPSGFSRPLGSLVEIRARAELRGVVSFRQAEVSTLSPIQTLASGNLLLPCPGLDSTGYGCMYISKVPAAQAAVTPSALSEPPTSFTLSNGIVQITLIQQGGWVIQSMLDLQNGAQEVLTAGPGNQIAVYYEMSADKSQVLGNLYQMGNELDPTSTRGTAFSPTRLARLTASTARWWSRGRIGGISWVRFTIRPINSA